MPSNAPLSGSYYISCYEIGAYAIEDRRFTHALNYNDDAGTVAARIARGRCQGRRRKGRPALAVAGAISVCGARRRYCRGVRLQHRVAESVFGWIQARNRH